MAVSITSAQGMRVVIMDFSSYLPLRISNFCPLCLSEAWQYSKKIIPDFVRAMTAFYLESARILTRFQITEQVSRQPALLFESSCPTSHIAAHKLHHPQHQ